MNQYLHDSLLVGGGALLISIIVGVTRFLVIAKALTIAPKDMITTYATPLAVDFGVTFACTAIGLGLFLWYIRAF